MGISLSRSFASARSFSACCSAVLAATVAVGCGQSPSGDDASAGHGGSSPAGGSAGTGALQGGTSGAASSAGGASGSASAAGGTTAGGGAGTPGTGGAAPSGAAGMAAGGAPAAAGTSAEAGAGATAGGAPAAGSGNGGSGGMVVTGAITDLRIEANPNSTISAYARWTTAEPSSSVIQFGEGTLTWEIAGKDNVTEHEVLVIGMHAQTAYQMRALSTGASGTLEALGTFTTGALPAQIPVATISTYDAAKAQPGWTLMNVQKGDGTNRAYSGAPPAAVIYDEAGKPVWYFINGTANERGGAISVDSTDKGVLMSASLTVGSGSPAVGPVEADWAGNTVWACKDPLCGVPDQLSHHAGKLTNGNHIVMRDSSAGGGRTSQIFIELDANIEQVHTIGVEDLFKPPSGASGDWAHGNSITVDLKNDFAYVSTRWLGLFKAQYSTKQLLWHLPAKYGQTNLNTQFGDMTFVPANSQFSDIHDPEIHDDGTVLFFDNGGFSGVIEDGNPGNRHTRAVEYAIDEAAKTATLVWEWPGSFTTDDWYKTQLYVPFWGDADRLANGNVLIAAGRRGTAASTPESRIIEVTRDAGVVAWELRFPKDYGVYRAERLAPPLLKKLAQ